jgi:hypothetical protein
VANSSQQRSEILPVHVLHREEVLPLNFPDVEDAADIWVRDLTGNADLVQKQVEPSLIPGGSGVQELQSDRHTKLDVIRLVHGTHAAPSQTADDAVAVGDERS